MSSSTPSKKQYKRVQHHDDGNNQNDDSSSSSEEEDYDIVQGSHPDKAGDDDDDKTQPTSNLRGHFSFDLDEEDLDLERYRTTSSASRVVIPKKLTLGNLWQAYLDTRLENRRRRAERLLARDSLTERTWMGVSSWCDLFDRGLLLFLCVVLIWIFLCWRTENASVVFLGGILLVVRLLFRPLVWCLCERHAQRKRQETMTIYNELNGANDNTIVEETQ